MTAKKELAPIPGHWRTPPAQTVEVGHAHIDIEDAGDGRWAFKVQNGGGPILFAAPAMQFWRWMDAVTLLHLKRKNEWVVELVHTLELEVARLARERDELNAELEVRGKCLKCAEEKIRRLLRYFGHRYNLADSALQGISQDIHAGIARDRPELFDDLRGPIRNLW